MRKSFFLLFLFFNLANLTRAQYVTIPDPTFRSQLKNAFPTCFNSSMQMDTTCAEIVTVQFLAIEHFSSVKTVEGLRYFKSLVEFNWTGEALEQLPVLPSSVKRIMIQGTKLTSLPAVLPPMLEKLDVEGNKLTKLPPLPSTLKYLYCARNLLDSLPNVPVGLEVLNTSNNRLGSLPPLAPTLKQLVCDHNNLIGLPPLPDSLTGLSCSYNNIVSLPPLPSTIKILRLDRNFLSSLPPLPVSLTSFFCSNNELTSLPNLPAGMLYMTLENNRGSLQFITTVTLPSNLKILNLSHNGLSALPAMPGKLEALGVYGNNLNCLPALPQSLKQIFLDATKVMCLPNSIPQLKVYHGVTSSSSVDMAICNPSNNSNACKAFPIIEGRVFVDLNQNGIFDVGEPVKIHAKINLSNGSYTFTDQDGLYQLAADSLRDYDVTITPEPFFTTLPGTSTFTFTTFDTVVVNNIVLHKTVSRDSLHIVLTPVTARARPGFKVSFKIDYKNAGSTDLPATNVTLNFDPTHLIFDSVSSPLVAVNTNKLTLSLPARPTGYWGSFIVHFTVKATSVLGSVLNTRASAVNNVVNHSDSSRMILTGAYDPNEKSATPTLSPLQVSEQMPIDYTIRFQNMGTDTAFHVVVTDTLSSLIQINSFKLESSSHPCRATLRDNVIAFEFRDILLPDNKVNEPLSHGFVRFTIRPLATLVEGDVIKNKASIYFDYNDPVITNNALTEVKTAEALPLFLVSFDGTLVSNLKASLKWETRNESNTAKFEIEAGINGFDFRRVDVLPANGSPVNSYSTMLELRDTRHRYFRLKMIDRDGSYTYSKVVFLRNSAGNQPGFTVAANPARKRVVLQNIEPKLFGTEAFLYNIVGQVVKRFYFNDIVTIAVENLPSGVYSLRTTAGVVKLSIAN